MNKKVFLCLVFFVFVFSVCLFSQDQEKQTQKQGIELIQLSPEQKLDRSVRNTTGNYIAGIAYAKSMGKTPEDYGKFFGELFSFAWEDIKGKGPVAFVQNWYRFLQTDRNSQMEILSVSESKVKAKMTVYGGTTIKALPYLGVTIDEYARFCGTWSALVAGFLGLDYEQNLEGDWIVFTVSKK